jgi:hypothetical protein
VWAYFFSFTVVFGWLFPYFEETYRPVIAERCRPPEDDFPLLPIFITSFHSSWVCRDYGPEWPKDMVDVTQAISDAIPRSDRAE